MTLFYNVRLKRIYASDMEFADADVPLYAYDQIKSGIIASRINFDVDDNLYKDRTAIGFLIRLMREIAKKETQTTKGFWFEQRSRKRFVTTTANSSASGSAGDAVTLTLSADDVLGIGKNYTMQIKLPFTSTYTNDVIVLSKLSTTTISVRANDPALKVIATTTGTKILVKATSYPQGDVSGDSVVVKPQKYQFVTQIFKDGYKLAKSAEKERMYGETERARVRLEKERDHLESLEWAMLFNGAEYIHEATNDDNVQRGTFQGIFDKLKNKSGNWDTYNTFNYEDFKRWVNYKIFVPRRLDGMQNKRLVLTNSAGINLFWELNEAKKCIMTETDVYGMPGVIRAKFGNGTFDLFNHPLVNDYYDDPDKPFFSALHMKYIKERVFRPTEFQANLQENNRDGIEDQYLTETSNMVALPELGGGFEPN